MSVRVTCLSPYPEDVIRGLFRGRYAVEVTVVPDPPGLDDVRREVAEADLVIGDRNHRHRIDRSVLEAMGRCLIVQQPAVGFDAIDHAAAAELGIPVANAAGYNADAVADWTAMAVLTLLRRGSWGDRRMHDGAWPKLEMLGRELGALTVGVVGLGNVGRAVAMRVLAFGSRVLFADTASRTLEGATQVPLDELLALADVVCLHVPLDVGTRHLIGSDALARMRPGGILVNASRGPVVDETALVEALRGGRLAGAGLDVYDGEPLSADSPLRGLDQVFLSPHVAGDTEQAEARLLEMVGTNLLRVLDGEEPLHIVNGVTRRHDDHARFARGPRPNGEE
jgi:phosphoglycerate dehydrogenase-like enzyme